MRFEKEIIDKCMIITIDHFHLEGFNDKMLDTIFKYFDEQLAEYINNNTLEADDSPLALARRYKAIEIIKRNRFDKKRNKFEDNSNMDNIYALTDKIQKEDKTEVKADGTTTDGIPSKTKVLGILPNEL